MSELDLSRYKDINKIPEKEITEDIERMSCDEYPNFAQDVWNKSGLYDSAREKFLRKFVIRYLKSEQFRKMTDGYFFLFVDGDYGGAYPTENDAVNMGYQMGYKGYEIYIFPMYPDIIYEKKENKILSKITT